MVVNSLDYQEYLHGGLLNGRYQKFKDLNEGSFGIVSVAKDTLNNDNLVAVKYNTGKLSDFSSYSPVPHETRSVSLNSKTKSVIRTNATYSQTGRSDKDVSKSVVVKETNQEVDMLRKVGYHPNITQLLESFDTFMIMEYAPRGDLHDAIHLGIAPVNTRDVVNVFMQLISAVEHCHTNGVYHRDIKPENILITENWTIQLTDFGLATDNLICQDFDVGSERYMAPELLDHDDMQSYYADKVDIWSLGICMLNIVFGKSPFTCANSKDKLFMNFANNRETLLEIFPSMSYDLFTVMINSLTIDPSNRDLEAIKHSLNNIEVLTYDYEFEDDDKIHDHVIKENIIVDSEHSSHKRFNSLELNQHQNSEVESSDSDENSPNAIDTVLDQWDHSLVKPLEIANTSPQKKKYEPPRRIYVDLDQCAPKKAHKRRFNGNQRKPIKVPEIHVSDYSSNNGLDFNRKDFFTPKSDFIDYMERANRKKKDLKTKGNYYVNPMNQSSNGNGTRPYNNSNNNSNNNNNNFNKSMKAWKKRKRRYSHAQNRDGYRSGNNRKTRSGRRYTNNNSNNTNNVKKGRQSFNRRNSSQNRRSSLNTGFMRPGCININYRPQSATLSGPKSIDGKYVPPNARYHCEPVFSEDEEDEDDIFSFERSNRQFKINDINNGLSKHMRKLKLFDDKHSSRETSHGTTSTLDSTNSSYEKYIPPHHRRHSVTHTNNGGILKKPLLHLNNLNANHPMDKKQVKILTPVSTSAPTDSVNWFNMRDKGYDLDSGIGGINEEDFKSDDNGEDYLFSIDEDQSFHNELNDYNNGGISISVGRL